MADNMIERLRTLAAARGTDTALVTVDAHGDTRYDYAQLDCRAAALARRLRGTDGWTEGLRVLLMMDSGIDYVAAFFGCLYAGATAVPAYPPESRRGQHLARLQAIAADAEAAFVVTTDALEASLGDAFAEIAPHAMRVSMDALVADPDVSSFEPYRAAPADVAFLQYTSGSTSSPKGVMVTHGSLWANEAAIRAGLSVTGDDVFVSWLPLYHDMGLIGTLSQPVFSGIPLVLMSPQYFLERPVRWLEAIARHRGTISGGPDFAYRLCADRVGDEQRDALDLSSWRVAFSGSEPVRKPTLDAFVARFASARFNAGALFPCYGLAEATLYVSGVARGAGARAASFDQSAMEQGRVAVAAREADSAALVSCGTAAPGHELAIVDMDSGAVLGPGRIGEICVSGPSVAAGYWRREDASAAAFRTRGGVTWLHTGDLGFLHDGDLYVAGRIKDLLIVRGRNLYPQDLELAIEREVEFVRRGRVAAFAVEIDGQAAIGIAAEVSPKMRKLIAAQDIAAALTEAVAQTCGETAGAIVLLDPGGLPKTSSGKVQRAACARGWQKRSLDAYAWFLQGRRVDIDETRHAVPATLNEMEAALATLWRDALPGDGALAADANFFAHGGNSLAAVQVAAAIRARWSIDFMPRDVFAAPVLRDAAACVRERVAHVTQGQAQTEALPLLDDAQRARSRASDAQRGLWLTWSHDPSSAAYNMSGVLRLHGALDVAALQRAFQTVVKQHDILRARFVIDDEGEAVQLIDESLDITLGHSCDEGAFEALADRIARAPFDLESGPLVRAHLVSVGADEHRLVLALHHIIADGWSVNVLLTALADAYYARPAPTARRVQSADYTAWSRASADASTLARQLDYWRAQLAADGDPAQAARLFSAAADATRGRQRSARFALEAALADRMRRLAGEHRASLFMTVLAVFNVVLHALSGKDDIRIGAPVSSRKRAEAQHLIGYFIDMQVLRSRVERQHDFGALVDAARETVLAAQEHQDVPFDRLMSALLPKRAQAGDALFQVKLTEQRPFAAHGFAPLDASLHVLLNDAPHFDLAVDFTDTGAQIDFLVAYDDAVFDAAFIARLTRLFATLAQRLTDAPQEAIGRHLDDAPSADVLTMWADSVARHPDKIALRDGARSATFAELDAAAGVLAARLVDHDAVREARVGVLAERSIEHVLGMLAALKAGATWVPLDPSAPAARLSAQLRDCGARVVLHAAALPEGLDTAQAVPLGVTFAAGANTQADLPCVVHPDQAAYMIYTSGSTGEPKGVVVSHRALGSYVRGMLDTLRPSPDSSFAMVSTPAADLGHTVLFGALCSARTLHLLAPELAFNPDQFARYMAEHAVGVLKIVPGHLSALLSAARPRDVLPCDALIVGGEATSAALLARLHGLEPACRIFNHYGPTETTVGVAMYAQRGPLDAQRDLPLGAALPGARLHVLDDALQPVEPGAIGELYVGGRCVARGYHGRAALSAERFVPDPFASGERLYRTGDRVRIHADGMLDYLGRADDQLKVRGYRVEPAEVERALRRVEGVREAAVFGHEAAGGLRLAAIVTGDATADTVRGALAAWLPEYMVPADIVTVAALPLNANGKLDRAALRALLPAASESAPVDAADAPHGATEVALAQIWAEVIGMEPGSISRHRNFFESGGDSILGLKVVAKARKAKLSITPKLLFQRLTLAQLAARLDEASAVKAAPHTTIPRLPEASRGRTLASHAQQRQWFMWQLAPESSAYHVAGGLWLSGDVDASALKASVEAIVARHEVLRTRFVADDAGQVQQWIEPRGTLDWQEASLPATQIDDAARVLASRPFDLAQGPLLRAGLFHTQEEGKGLFVLAMHHIVSDGWSVRVLLEELVAHYRAAVLKEPLKLSALPVQYADYAAWQRDWLEAGEREQQLTYWRKALGDTQPVLALPTDAPRQANASYRAARYRLRMPQALSQAVKSRAQGTSTTPFMVLLAAFQALLHRYTGQEDIRIGVPVANRHRVETEGLIGFFVNTQVLRADVNGEASLEALLQQTRQTTLDAQAHQDLPFDVLVDALRPERSLSHTPLFQVMFNHQRSDWRVLEQLPGLSIEPYALPDEAALFELTLNIIESTDGTLEAEFIYADELFDAASIERLGAHYANVLRALTDDPGQRVGEIALLDAAQWRQLREWGSGSTQAQQADDFVHRRIAACAQATPDAPAVTGIDGRMTYAELDRRANRLAARLMREGVGPEVRVGLAMSRTASLTAAMLGILKAGGAYVPLDPAYPLARLTHMANDSGIALLLVDDASEAHLRDACRVPTLNLDTLDLSVEPDTGPAPALHPDNLAYVVYTSGTTGRPKGVAVAHGALASHCRAIGELFGYDASDCCLHFASISFDVAAEELWVPLTHGASVLMRDDEVWPAGRLADEIRTHGVTSLNVPPAYADAFARETAAGTVSVRTCIVGGEAWSRAGFDAVRERLAPQRIFNAYGPSETVITPTVWHADEHAFDSAYAPIGQPVGARSAWVLDARKNPVPPGVPGELHIGGAALARGYLGQPGMSAARFVPDPFSDTPGARLYCTGDLVRWRADGQLDYLGRLDEQVKVRGFRIEPGEIEARLRMQDGVAEAVVVALDAADGTASRRLAAYVTAAAGQPLAPAVLRAALGTTLPDYMVPSWLTVLDALPLTPNGKIDRRALPAPEIVAAPLCEAPQGETESTLAGIWSQLLRRESIGRHENFFELGGDSIMGLQIVARARRAGLGLSARQIFEQQTIAQLASVVTPLDASPAEAALPDSRVDTSAPVPLLPIQAWFFSEPFAARDHFNQAVLLDVGRALDTGALQDALRAVIAHHDSLRVRFEPCASGWRQCYATEDEAAPSLEVIENVPLAEIEKHGDAAQASLDIEHGPLLRALALGIEDGTWRLFIAIHHLVVDTVSWRILIDDLQRVHAQRLRGEAAALPERTTSCQAFARQLHEAARAPEVERDLTHWRRLADVPAALPPGVPQAPGGPQRAVVQFDCATTRRLQQDASAAYRTQLVDLLLLATGRALCAFAGSAALRIDLEGHGREPLSGHADLSRTVGWLTSVYPFELAPTGEPGAALKRVKEARRAVPRRGMSFNLLKYLGAPPSRAALAGIGHADVLFNYLGQFDDHDPGQGWQLATEASGRTSSELNRATHALEISAQVHRGALSLTLLHPRGDRYDAATLTTLADAVQRELLAVLAHCESGASGLTPSDVPLAGIDQARLDALPVRAADVADLYPLAPMQTGIVFHSLLGQQPGAYVNQLRVDIGRLDGVRFEAAWAAVAARHDTLRTGFLSFDDAPRQWVARSIATPFFVEDWRNGEASTLDARLDRFAAARVTQGFDLARAPLWRVDVLRTDADRHHFVWTFHHALLDGWSAAQLLAEVLATYEGRPATGVPGRYRDFIAWLGQRPQAVGETWWREQLSALEGPTLLSHALPAPSRADATSAASYGTHALTWDAARAASLGGFAKSRRVTPNTLVQAAWLVLLQRYTGQRAVSFGATVAGRPEALAGADRTLGLFINTIPVIGAPDPATSVAAWLERVQRQGVAAREHEHVALYDIQRWARIEGGQALFDSIVVFENYPVDDILRASGARELQFSGLRNEDRTSYPLTLSVTQGRAGEEALRIDFDYAGDIFDAAQIARMAGHLSALLDAFIAAPDAPLGALDMLAPGERAQLESWSSAPDVAASTPVHLRIAQQAARAPDVQALVLDDESIDYGTLDRRAERVARHLRAAGVGPEARVGVLIERSLTMIVAILGVLKAGGAYVPLDPSYPAERLAFMIEDSGIAVALTAPTEETSDVPVDALARLGVRTLDVHRMTEDGATPSTAPAASGPSQLAYVIYTSGSTGRPKGVGITHDGLARHTDVSIGMFGITSRDRVLQFSTFNFDGFVEQVFPTLAAGATLILRGPELWSSERFLEQVAQQRITVADLTTAYWNALAQDFAERGADAVRARCGTLRRVHAGGEAMPANGVRAWRAAGLAHVALANTYGPSEAVVTATLFDCTPYVRNEAALPAQIPLGTPLDGRTLYVLDPQLNLVPMGAAGELCIGGALLARGYLGRPGLTATRFIADPHARTPGARLYRTGDVVRWNEDGTLAYLGRTDHQVKVRGFRVELGEIEALLAQQPNVREAAVITRDGPTGVRVLAYAVPAAGATLDGRQLREQLAASLPDYMVPAAVTVLDRMPLNPNGKMDRHALPAPAALTSAALADPPEGEMEAALAEIWSGVLDVSPVRRADRFFELGGHSLAAMQVQSALRARLGIDAPLADLMRNQPLHELAAALDALKHAVADDAAMAGAMRDILAQL